MRTVAGQRRGRDWFVDPEASVVEVVDQVTGICGPQLFVQARLHGRAMPGFVFDLQEGSSATKRAATGTDRFAVFERTAMPGAVTLSTPARRLGVTFVRFHCTALGKEVPGVGVVSSIPDLDGQFHVTHRGEVTLPKANVTRCFFDYTNTTRADLLAALAQPSRSPQYGDASAVYHAFDVPARAGGGFLRMCLFIAEPSPGSGPSGLGFSAQGDARGFDPNFDIDRCRAVMYADLDQGKAAIRLNPSCREYGDCCTQAATSSFTAKTGGNAFTIDYGFLSCAYPLPKFTGPGISGTLTFSYGDGSVRVDGQVDGYPSIEVYRDRGAVGVAPTCVFRQRETSITALGGARGEKDVHTGTGCPG